MRTILNISVPEATARQIKENVKERGFASVSEYIRHLIRETEERRLVEGLRKSEREFKQGKGRVLRSLADLD